MRRIGERDALVVDQDVRVMIGLLGFRREAVHEGDRFEKIVERVLLANRVSVERPAVQRLETPFGIFACQLHCTSLAGRSHYSGLRALTSSRRRRADSTASRDSFC